MEKLLSKGTLNSVWRVLIMFLHKREHWEGALQYIYINPKKVEIQFKAILSNPEKGLKIEKKICYHFQVF